ncbi:MAG TPA: substrate-binding domain-containing protein [Vicinamibacterales bacterium]|nr:substrate-binding domain-containing protein [Vicinamibacterales bacterium]
MLQHIRGATVAALVLLLPAGLRAQEVSYTLVVHTTNPIAHLSRDQVSKIFLRKITLWDDRQPVLPIDQTPDSPVRRSFTKQILQRTIAWVETWWQQQTFAGVGVAPPERRSDLEVLEYIRKYPTAIGYVRADVPIGSDVKTVTVTP